MSFILLRLLIVLLFLLVLLLFGYPLTIYVLSKFVPKDLHKADITPSVTLIIPCYNENHIIREKIQNSLTMKYPRSKLEIIVVDSASTDGTTETVRSFSDKIELIEQPERVGKATAINEAIKKATGEIVVLTDADAFVDENAVKNLIKNFADPCVGAVVGRYEMHGSNKISTSMASFFSIFKERIRYYESIIDSASYYTGELLAYRRDLIDFIDSDIVSDDQFILLKIREKGYRCIAEPASIVSENIVTSIGDHIRNRRRTTFGTLQVSARFKGILFNPRYSAFGYLIYPMYLARILFFPILCFLVELCLLLLLPTYIKNASKIMLLIVVIAAFFLFIIESLSSDKMGIIQGLFCILILQVSIILGILDFALGRHEYSSWPKLSKGTLKRKEAIL